MVDVLVTARTTKPGVYIGRVNRPAPSGLTGFVRLPAFVGRGSRLRTVFNQPIRRSYLSDVSLSLPTVAPHVVSLAQPALNDQTVARLFRSDGNIVPASKWQFLESTPGSGVYNSVLLAPEAFSLNVSYSLDYQSTSRTIRDELPFDEVREVRFVGDTENQDLYEEYVNYFIPVSITAPTADVGNAYSGSSAHGFDPAQIVGTIAGPFTFVGGEVLNVTINGTAFVVNWTAGARTTAAAAAVINAVISAQGTAFEATGGFLGIRSNSFDPGISRILVSAGTANAILGTTSAQFPSAAMVTATYTTAGYFRKVSGTGSPVVGVRGTSSSNHRYNRRIRISFGAPGGTIPATIQTFVDSGASIPEVASGASLTAAQVFGGSGVGTQPQLPFHSGVPTTGTSVSFNTPAGVSVPVNFTDITGDVIQIIVDNTGGLITGNEVYETTLLAPSAIEVDSALANTQQHSSFSAVGSGAFTQTGVTPNYATSIAGSAAGTGTVAIRDDAEFTGLANKRYALICTASAGGPGARTATFVWQAWGEYDDLAYNGSSRTFVITEATGTNALVTLGDGVLLSFSFGASNFTVNDTFWFQANAARTFITAKDDREYQISVSAVGLVGSNNQVTFSFETGTTEGSFGLLTATGPQGKLWFPGVVNLWARNVSSQVSIANRYVIGDEWTWDTVNEDVLDWSLTSLTTETVDPTQIFTDSLGVITGTVGLRYIVLDEVPTDIRYIRDTVTGALISSYSIPSATQPYVAFTTAPTNPIEIRYETIGIEPAPAGLYYITANTIRPAEFFNSPIRALSYEEASRILGPSSTSNDLLIMAQLALEDNDAPGAYFCQAADSDGDGVITNVDVNNAIEATEDERNLTDVIVLNTFGSLSSALRNNEKMNDPFERGERALWVGCPVGTAIGDQNTAGTLIFLASRTLQVYGENPAHGKRVLVGNHTATKTIVLTDGTQVVRTLDGSFVAGAIAALNASFSDPGETLLRKNISGFDSMNTFSEPEQLLLIGSGIIFCSNVGDDLAPVFRIEESTTVDRSSDDNNEISVAINQKEYTTRVIRGQMDNSLISIVPPSEQAGIAIVQTFLVEILTGLVAQGIIGPYTDDSGNARPIDPDEDVRVFRARDSRTAYNFQYWWNARYPIKRLFGLYSVDRRFFGDSV